MPKLKVAFLSHTLVGVISTRSLPLPSVPGLIELSRIEATSNEGCAHKTIANKTIKQINRITMGLKKIIDELGLYLLCSTSSAAFNQKTTGFDSLGAMSIEPKLLVYAAVGILIFLKHREIAKAIEDFDNNFPRGGPPNPMHPSPAGDDALLRRKSPKKSSPILRTCR